MIKSVIVHCGDRSSAIDLSEARDADPFSTIPMPVPLEQIRGKALKEKITEVERSLARARVGLSGVRGARRTGYNEEIAELTEALKLLKDRLTGDAEFRWTYKVFGAWRHAAEKRGATFTEHSRDRGRVTETIARVNGVKIGSYNEDVFHGGSGWLVYEPPVKARDVRLTLNSIAAAAKAQMPDVAKLELVRGNGYFYVVGEWKKKRKGQPIPITSGGIYTNTLGTDGPKFGMSFWISEVKRVVEADKPYDYDDL